MKQLKLRIFWTFSFVMGLSFFAIPATAQEPSPMLKMARQEMPGAFKSEAESIALYNKIHNAPNPEPLLKGYIGAVNIARARHAPIMDKRGYLKTGIAMLEEAIKEKPNNTELLFLRLTIQSKLPSFLGYNDNIDADKKFVLTNFSSTPSPLKEKIAHFILKSEDFTDAEKAMVK
ncbi:MAG: hypothetical protein M3Q95_12065 [Bacteroidota bacterium]|nr:hypothetical protein [Bacteroidota bacterium]